MSRVKLRRLRVSGVDRSDAEITFGPGLTLITGNSDTGKTHVLECIDFALGSDALPEEIDERAGYDLVALELLSDGEPLVLARRFSSPETSLHFQGPIEEWDGESGRELKATLKGAGDAETLSGLLLDMSHFDTAVPVVRNKRAEHQRLSFRTFAPMALVDEAAIISPDSPMLAAQSVQQTASRSVFGIVLTGKAPSLKEVEAMREAHGRREDADKRLAVLVPMIEDLRAEIEDAEPGRAELETDLERIEAELAEVSETVSKGGERARGLMGERNRELAKVERAQREANASRELEARFRLLSEHYRADVRRLEFVIEGGHFFEQIEASHCPTCGHPIAAGADSDCHPESAGFAAVEKAAGAEIGKLAPRMRDLEEAIGDAKKREADFSAVAAKGRERAEYLDGEIETVANPTAEAARGRVADITARRRTLEDQVLRFRELDRFLAAEQEASVASREKVEGFRPEQDAQALIALCAEIRELLADWKFPLHSDVSFDLASSDIKVEGKKRSSFGKGVKAITHTAFTVGLMLHCLSAGTPHPGFVAIDSPLTPFKGITDDIEDPELSSEVHLALLYSLAKMDDAQTILIENIDPPGAIRDLAVVHQFPGAGPAARAGFYPTSTDSD